MPDGEPAAKAKKPAPRRAAKADGGAAVLEKIAAMPEPFRAMGERLHAVILRAAPGLRPTVWYGMPGYAKDGPCLCFFRADKYLTFGLTEKANFPADGDPDPLTACAWFLTALDDATEARIAAIVRRAAG